MSAFIQQVMTGESTQHHETIFWSKGKEDEWAVRRGDWKLHWTKGNLELVSLADDPSEQKNVAAGHFAKVQELSNAYDQWIAKMVDPITGGQKRVDSFKPADTNPTPEKKELTERELKREQIRAEREKQREAEKKTKNQS
ncbi:MAG: hypothetical protein GY903_25970 [Fuerstiella sp.]|nr:hypothetical protein [Fuerstiella sp.]MCP4857946.1 hypothetical protein [Fuerstiella sp.]